MGQHPTPGAPGRRHTFARRVGLFGSTVEGTAAGVYGLIISSAVMAASHAESAVAVVAAVVVTLLIYWSAERYARLVAERIHEGHRPGRSQVLAQVTSGWEMVTASAVPVAALVVLRLGGVELRAALFAALVCSTLLLCLAGWEMDRHGRLTRAERIVSTAVAGTFGVAMIVLKVALH
jgi:hypothetical protein